MVIEPPGSRDGESQTRRTQHSHRIPVSLIHELKPDLAFSPASPPPLYGPPSTTEVRRNSQGPHLATSESASKLFRAAMFLKKQRAQLAQGHQKKKKWRVIFSNREDPGHIWAEVRLQSHSGHMLILTLLGSPPMGTLSFSTVKGDHYITFCW